MNKIIIISILLNCSIYSFGQQKEEINLIQADSTWGKEIIQIPFWFAPEINFNGHEDIRFAKGWEKIDSTGFWTYVFAWDINLNTKPTTKFFEDNLKLYFDGLMKVVNEDTLLIIPKTKALFIEKERKKEITTFTGILEIYDAFTTKKIIKLNVTIESYYCKKTKTFIPLFRFSPKDFNHEAWKMLNQVRLLPNICKDKLKDNK
ncbi:hypothetical protein [Flavobacterium sp. UBA7663]|uniref:hypothetical protein n=1 Tax=Flavobacterium sp. UBA7663 TaxID=1946557 RepID=UPI0025B85B22|nr:hypothetical protein [Flavobacterium sp. UBA7663]